jgi:hypothetical protein
MPSDFGAPTRRERFAAASVDLLQRAGLTRLAYSDVMRLAFARRANAANASDCFRCWARPEAVCVA